MNPDPILHIQQQLVELEKKMLQETEKRQTLFKDIHSQQYPAAQNMIHYLTLRNEDIRELQDILHIHGLSSLASSEGHIHSQLQSILQRLGKHYCREELDACTYEFNLEQIRQKSQTLFGEKK